MATVVVLAKAPVPGQVKTRLCPPCTPVEASAIAEAALMDTLDAVSRCKATRRVIALDGQRGSWLDAAAAEFDVIAQRGGGLDVRLADAFDDVLAGSGEPCVLIAMDTPHVRPADLDNAIDALARASAVLGLAEDGGFWLVGLRKASRASFVGVPMSTPTTGVDQLHRLRSVHGKVAVLETMRDVDDVADLEWLSANHPTLRTAAVWQRQRGGETGL